jgi:hypothetical protein
MASVDWQKHSGGTSVKAQFRHCDKDERLKAEHANEEIDKSLIYKNLSFGAFNGDYKSICHAYDERIKYIDEHAGLKKKPRKDRVTCMSWSISCPAGMSDDMASKWFTDVYDLLNTEYSDVLGASAHFDEVHEYVDASTGETAVSRPHMHVFVLPVVEKDGFRRLVGKDFSKRENIVKLNNSIQKLTEDKYPGYTFMTGVKHPGEYQTVEDLKRRSKEAQAIQAEKEKALQEIEREKSNALQVIEGAKNDALDMAISLDKQNAEREVNLDAREKRLDERESKMEEKEQFMQWSYPTKAGKQIPILRLFEMFRKELKKAENEKKQSLPKHSSAPKPVDYVQKAIAEAIKPAVNKAYEDAQENMQRRVLHTLDYSDENESDEYSY